MKLTNAKVRKDIEALERRITEGPGTVPAEQRRAAADAKPVEGSAALAAYLEKVRKHAYKVTDEEVAALRAAGATDDELFELTVAAAFGAAKERLGAGLAAVATVYEES